MSYGGPYGSDEIADVHVAGYMIFGDPRDRAPVRDHRRRAKPGDPPEPNAQWNELVGQWERWDEASQGWVVVGAPGDGVDTYWDDDAEDDDGDDDEGETSP